MFGELDDSNIYESFDAFSNENGPEDDASDFSFGDDSETTAGPQGNDDFLDMSSYSERMGQPQQQQVPPQPQAGGAAYGNVPPAANSQVPQDDIMQGYEPQQQAPQQAPEKKSAGGVFFLLVLVVLAAAAGGLFYYKNYMQPQGGSPEQAAGDYFYDQATEQGAVTPQGENAPAPDAAQQAADGSVATVDVDLNSSQAPDAQTQEAAGAQAGADKTAQANEKDLSPLERAQLKEKQDAQNAKSFSNRVIIPVMAGGRVDPFVPYMQRVSAENAPKFDLIAPPSSVPTTDPVVEEIVQTKISGIMFDAARPSAIVNIGGTDQLVHKGDVVNGFSVLDITKKSVTLKYGANVYQASVGESVGEGVNLNPVSNLSRSFGGAYSKTPNNAIHF